MDKQKIVFIVDDGLPSGGLFDALKEFGKAYNIDVESIKLSDTLQGTHPKTVIWDEAPLSVPEHMPYLDFSDLERRCLGLADAVLSDGTTLVNYKTGRRPSEPVYLPSHRIQQDIYAMIAEATGKNRELIKELNFPHAYGTGGFFGGLQQIPRKPEKSRYFASPYGVNNIGADHPSRKREPKGPRGKWGKPK